MQEAISNDAIHEALKQHFADGEVQVEGDGYKYQITVVSPAFEGKNTVQRHKMIYALLKEAITGGALHALTLNTLTPDEV